MGDPLHADLCQKWIDSERSEMRFLKRVGAGVIGVGVLLIVVSLVIDGIDPESVRGMGMKLLGSFTAIMAGLPYAISAKRKRKVASIDFIRRIFAMEGTEDARGEVYERYAELAHAQFQKLLEAHLEKLA